MFEMFKWKSKAAQRALDVVQESLAMRNARLVSEATKTTSQIGDLTARLRATATMNLRHQLRIFALEEYLDIEPKVRKNGSVKYVKSKKSK